MSLSFLHSGLYTTIQDQGRSRGGRLGIPSSGAMDKISLNLANMLVSNTQEDAAIECTVIGPKIRFDQDTIISVCGAVVQPFLDDIPFMMNEPIHVSAGNVLHFGRLVRGTRYYIAIAGGVQSPTHLGSRSACITSRIGHLISRGDQLDIGTPNLTKHNINAIRQLGCHAIEATIGPEYSDMDSSIPDLGATLSATFTIQANSNRMAYSVQNIPALIHNLSILSSGVLPGTVQLTPNGDLMFLMRDAQTTGGYPRILQLTEQGICDLAQLKAGESFVCNIIT